MKSERVRGIEVLSLTVAERTELRSYWLQVKRHEAADCTSSGITTTTTSEDAMPKDREENLGGPVQLTVQTDIHSGAGIEITPNG